jgi:phosphoenolpyruvate synthase/pyruvate phosphate dikinase
LAAAAGHVGMIGDLAKTLMDYAYGKNRPQGFNNVLIEAAENTATTAASLAKAITEDGFDPNVFIAAGSQMLEDNLQVYRIILANLSAEKKEDIERANKMRDLRVFKTISGDDIVDLTSPFIRPLAGQKMREFKQAKTPEEALEILPDLIDRALTRAGDSPEKLKKELSKIKRNSYQTMPNPERMPESFLRYITFLSKSQGEEVAQERLLDYLMQNTVNKVKSGLIPTIGDN